jgi:arylsulfatase A-like enzyme
LPGSTIATCTPRTRPRPFDRKFAPTADTILPWLAARVTPCAATTPTRPGRRVAQYDGEIRYVDHQIAQLLAVLERRGLLDDTVVVITADHGRASRARPAGARSDALRGGAPRAAHRRTAGRTRRVVDEVVSTMDLFPTLLELAGSPRPRRTR